MGRVLFYTFWAPIVYTLSMTTRETVFMVDGKRFLYRQCGRDHVPLVLLFAHGSTQTLMDSADVLRCGTLDWNDDLTPWPYQEFGGKGFDFARTVKKALAQIDTSVYDDVICAGYSLGGLFSLYAPGLIPQITMAAAASPSVWYPGFAEYMKKNPPAHLKEVSLSVGRKERKAAACLEEIAGLFAVPCHYQLEPGGHFHEPEARLARAIEQLSWKDSNC